MADRIEQQFLIDAAAAIQTLMQLDQGFQTFEKRLNSVAQSVQNFNTGIKGGSSAITSYRQSVQATAAAINKSAQNTNQLINNSSGLSNVSSQYGSIVRNLDEMYDRARKFGITAETLSRVALTQGLVRGYNAVRDAVVDAHREAAEFQKQVALISTISKGVTNSDIAEGIEDISRSFNLPVLETATGVYNALSNQVGEFGETLGFTAEAAKFAKATNSTLADSVDLLSAVINSYGLTSQDTNRIASILFTTIDEGRVTASELGNTFGRVLPSAVQLGISLEEVSAAVSLISVQGLNSAETLTRVNALFTTLLKPSEALKKTYKELGVESGELGIRQFGLATFLQKVIEAGGETSAELAKLAPNIRGFGGIAGVTAKGVDAFTAAVEKNKKAVKDDAVGNAYAKATATNAEVLSRAYNDLSLELLQFGKYTVDSFADATRAVQQFADANPLAVQAAEVLGTGMATGAANTLALGAAVFGAAGAMRVFNYVMLANPALRFAAAIGIATGAMLSFVKQQQELNVQASLKPVGDEEARNVEQLKKVTAEATASFESNYKTIRQSIAAALNGAGEAKDNYTKAIQAIMRQNTTLVDSTDLALDRIIDARRKYVSELSRAASDANSQVEASQKRIADLQSGQSNRTFEASLSGLSDANQVLKLTQRASAIANKAAADLEAAARSGTQQDINRALAQFGQAQDAADEAQAIAKRTGNRALEASTAKELNSISNRQIDAEKTLIDLQLKRKKAADEERRQQEVILKNLERQAKIVLENTGQFNDQGERFTAKELADRERKRNLALNELIGAQFKKGDFDLADVLGLAKFTADFKADLSKGATELQTQLSNSDLGITTQIDSAMREFNASPFVERLRSAIAKEGGLIKADELVTPKQLETLGSEFERVIKDKLESIRELTINAANVGSNQRELNLALDQLDRRDVNRSPHISDSAKGVANAFDDAGDQLRKFASDGRFTAEEIENVKSKMKELEDTVNQFKNSSGGGLSYNSLFLPDEALILNALKQVKELAEAQKTVDRELQSGDAASKAREVSDALDSMRTATPVAETGEVSSNLQTAVQYSGRLASNTQSAAIAMQSYVTAALQLSAGGTVQTAQHGNAMMHYFANGGQARGTDTINAMVAPGESIINSRSTARFFSQIQAMNAGQLPVFRAQQGSVTNVGDINVTVSGGGSSTQTGRAIVSEIRRELRRGTSRL